MSDPNSPEQTRAALAACYRLFARAGMDDLVFTHLSARLPGRQNRFLFIRFGSLFEEVTASNLLEVDLDGNRVMGSDAGAAGEIDTDIVADIVADIGAVNPAGWIVHRTVYEAVPEACCVMHLHTLAGTAVSAQSDGLLPINQFATTYHGRFAYHDYDGPGLHAEERVNFAAALAGRPMMFLRNHGTLTYGSSIAEAYMLMHYLERSCQIQLAAQAGGGALALPSPDVIDRTARTGQGTGDSRFHEIGFSALLRLLDREDPSYRN